MKPYKLYGEELRKDNPNKFSTLLWKISDKFMHRLNFHMIHESRRGRRFDLNGQNHLF
tara:strand:+ start:239 stop:412 length:174 start_codon:yes stop_codon:yes gene_type:complete